MGKKRIALVSEKPEKKIPAEKKGRAVVKTGKEHGRLADVGTKALEEATAIEEKTKKLEEEIAKKKKGAKKVPGQRYQAARKKINRSKYYFISEAIKLLKSVSISRFNGSVDVHLITRKTGLKGEVKFPNSTGKTQKIRIADEKLFKELEKGKINFTGLVTTPAMMPKLAKYAKLLGPRGLMPNPKAGTITDKPEQLVKELSAKTSWRTESKAPLIHLSIGKVDSPEKHLEENFKALIEAVGRRNIKKAVLAPTMGPGIKCLLQN